jgi:hypothetical protein
MDSENIAVPPPVWLCMGCVVVPAVGSGRVAAVGAVVVAVTSEVPWWFLWLFGLDIATGGSVLDEDGGMGATEMTVGIGAFKNSVTSFKAR